MHFTEHTFPFVKESGKKHSIPSQINDIKLKDFVLCFKAMVFIIYLDFY